jgi:hypothetical protein
MKNMKNKIKLMAAAAVLGSAVTSCSLDMLPLNEVVLENYWTDKSDVESVVNSCYAAMQEGGYISSLIVWGENRSDNTTPNTDASNDLRYLMKGNLKTTNPYCNWAAFYNVINRCNTVLYYAAQVAQEDPNYTPSDYNITQAEVKFLRAYSYLTLIKTFKDVPFSLEPSIDDNVDYQLPRTPFKTILTALIDDIESCKNFPPVRYSTPIYNTGRVTRDAMYALLAELYLWRASDYEADLAAKQSDYQACVACCDFVINHKINQFRENNFLSADNEAVDLTQVYDTYVYSAYGIPLLKEEGNSTANGPQGYNAIFGTGNSFESIFEITYTSGTDDTKNTDVSLMYGGYENKDATAVKRLVVANENLISTEPTQSAYNNDALFVVPSDYRSIENFHYTGGGGTQNIYKYVVRNNVAGSTQTTLAGSVGTKFTAPDSKATQSVRSWLYQYENWILYRLSEILLFRAEAEIELAGLIDKAAAATTDFTGYHTGASLSSPADLYADAFNLICAVYMRSNPVVKGATTHNYMPKNSSYKYDDYVKLLMRERQREFLFEGKRYYDLVRQARREGSTSKLQEAITSKFGEAPKSILIKMSNLDFMYMPILKSQIKVNPKLTQNPCYNDEEESVKN